jgi:hypothetical protein
MSCFFDQILAMKSKNLPSKFSTALAPHPPFCVATHHNCVCNHATLCAMQLAQSLAQWVKKLTSFCCSTDGSKMFCTMPHDCGTTLHCTVHKLCDQLSFQFVPFQSLCFQNLNEIAIAVMLSWLIKLTLGPKLLEPLGLKN